MNRRRFLTSLFVGVPAVYVAEKKGWLTWLYDLFKPRVDTIALQLEHVRSKLPTFFREDDVFLRMIETRPVELLSTRAVRIPLQLKPQPYPYLDVK